MTKSYMRGHEIYFSSLGVWLYSDNNEPADDSRPCKKCGNYPTIEGFDHCIGELKNVSSACCGHGIEEPYNK